jgi:hypothetical protein
MQRLSIGRFELMAGAAIVLGSVYVAWLGFHVQTMGDYPNDYAPAMNALLAGHAAAFFDHLPTNGAGGSLLLRFPGALLGKLLIGTQHAIFRFGALECLLVLGALGLYLARGPRRGGQSALSAVSIVILLIAAPALLDAIRFGHPEEPLGAALCVAAVLSAGGGRSSLAGIALGLAVINKPWGVLAIGPVLLAARQGRVRVAVIAGSVGALWALGAYLGSPGHFGRTVLGASTSVVAHPVDVWWPLAHLHAEPGVMRAYFPPAVVSEHARELAVVLVLPLSLPLARLLERTMEQCLALLALLFLIRCLLDPSNHVYYQVPFVVALAAYEVRGGRAPVTALLALAGFWLVFHTISGLGSLDLQFVAYLAVSLPLLMVVARPALGLRVPSGETRAVADLGYRAAA